MGGCKVRRKGDLRVDSCSCFTVNVDIVSSRVSVHQASNKPFSVRHKLLLSPPSPAHRKPSPTEHWPCQKDVNEEASGPTCLRAIITNPFSLKISSDSVIYTYITTTCTRLEALLLLRRLPVYEYLPPPAGTDGCVWHDLHEETSSTPSTRCGLAAAWCFAADAGSQTPNAPAAAPIRRWESDRQSGCSEGKKLKTAGRTHPLGCHSCVAWKYLNLKSCISLLTLMAGGSIFISAWPHVCLAESLTDVWVSDWLQMENEKARVISLLCGMCSRHNRAPIFTVCWVVSHLNKSTSRLILFKGW